MKIWDKGTAIDTIMENFTVGRDREMDTRLARWDVVGSIAHATMLGQTGLIPHDAATALVDALSDILAEFDAHGCTIDSAAEDIHSHVEALLVQRLGDTGKMVHTGRSRNDQVALDIALFMRHELRTIRGEVISVAEILLGLAEKYAHLPLPGFTHYQVAMPSSFGLWFGSTAELLLEDVRVLDVAIDAANANPLGSAAGYGTRLPLDRDTTTRALNFDRMYVTAPCAQAARGRTERLAAMAMAQVASTVARFAADVVHFASSVYGCITLPDAFTTGSSIMPHKKNPDVFEVLRARCNRLQSIPTQIAMVLQNLPSGYHRDVQFIKDVIIPAIDEMHTVLTVAAHVIPVIQPVEGLLDAPAMDSLFSVDRVDDLVKQGIPFREAYRIVAQRIAEGTSMRGEAPFQVDGSGSLGSPRNPGLHHIRARLNDLR
ncbi:MAG: argininosuccinate lyase [Candidatus Kapabacteria bacterium]|jgi:argininosuccinate lyase|nr:argininosuccinate lyase [Candidatus Kapabacteria bacterium]